MASSLNFSPRVKALLPAEILERMRILPIDVRDDKLCLIALNPLSDQHLIELKMLTGIEDYELQIVGSDVIEAYIDIFLDGSLFTPPKLTTQ